MGLRIISWCHVVAFTGACAAFGCGSSEKQPATNGKDGAPNSNGGATSTSSGGAPGNGGAVSGTGGAANTGGTTTSTGGTKGTGGDTFGNVETADPANSGDSVLMHHRHLNRDGLYTQPTFTKAAISGLKQDLAFAPTFANDAVYAQPLFVDGGGSGKDLVIVATEGNNVYAFDAANGAQAWEAKLGDPTPRTLMTCGNIDPYGVTGTPVIDFASRTVFVTGLVHPAGNQQNQKYLVFALSLDTGAVKSGWPVDVGAKVGTAALPFDQTTTGQRGALALVGGTLYVPFGGLYGDCGNYNGRVVAISITDPTSVKTWATALNAGGVWAPGGVSSDGKYVYVATGNTEGAKKTGASYVWGGGDAIVRLGTGTAFTGTPAYFAPTNWHDLDAADLDMGTSPVLFDQAASTPNHLALLFGKDGSAYLVDRANLAGVGSALGAAAGSHASKHVASGAIITAPVLYTTPTATYVSFRASGTSCKSGSGSLTTLTIAPGSPPTLVSSWCAGSGSSSPIVTTSDGTKDAIVWLTGSDGNGQLQAFDGDTGVAIPFAGSNVSMPNMRHFNSPIAAKGKIYVAADGAVYAFSIQ